MSNAKPHQQVPGAVIAVLGGAHAGPFAAHRAARAITKETVEHYLTSSPPWMAGFRQRG